MNVTMQPRPRLSLLNPGLLKEIGLPALMVSLVLFVSAMALLGANVSEMRNSYSRVQRVNETLIQIAMVNADMLRAEMIVRGYALSGDPVYLVWKDEADGNLRKRLAALGKMFADEPAQRTDLSRLRVLLREHAGTLDNLVNMIPTDKVLVTAKIVEYGKAARRVPIEKLLLTMSARENRLLEKRQRSAEALVEEAYHSAVAISGVALILGAFGFAFVFQGARLERRRES
jgi:CHASE3 domain sensor protein